MQTSTAQEITPSPDAHLASMVFVCDSPLILVSSDAAVDNFFHLGNGYLVKAGRLHSLQSENRRAVKGRNLSEKSNKHTHKG